MRKIIATLLISFFCFTGFAVEESSQSTENMPQENNVKFSTEVGLTATFPAAALISVKEKIKIPAMNFNSPLTQGNNVTIKIGMELSPLTLEGKTEVVWTPIAFLELYGSLFAGSGWNIVRKKASDSLFGLAEALPAADKTTRYVPFNFTKTYWGGQLGGAFQFDLGAVIKHDWAHVVFRTDQVAKYSALSGMSKDKSWVYQAGAPRRNGWQYIGSYVFGYQMPIPLNMIAMMAETTKDLHKTPANRKDWGEDKMQVVFGPVFNFKILEWMDLMLAVQAETKNQYVSPNDFYQYRKLANPTRKVFFKRAALIFTMTFNHN